VAHHIYRLEKLAHGMDEIKTTAIENVIYTVHVNHKMKAILFS